jgi:hypothetical protein
MSNKKIECEITGISALMMHQYPMIPIESIEKRSPEEQAEYAAYRIPATRELYIPGIAIQRALIAGAGFSKGKGRATLQKPVAACVLIAPEYCGLGVTEYSIDARPVVIPATKGRVIRYRPRLDTWKVAFSIEYDDNLLKESEVRRVVDDTGSRVGILEFRPEKKGPFGRFMVTSWSG